MPNRQLTSPTKLFYSYSHRDMRFREKYGESAGFAQKGRAASRMVGPADFAWTPYTSSHPDKNESG